MSISRTTIIRGPAIITYDSVVMYTEDDIILTPGLTTFDVPTSMFGKADVRLDDIVTEVTFKPVGNWGYRSVLYPHANPTIGSSLFGATDKDLTIQTLAGQLLTWKAAAITKMPDLTLSANKTMFGSATFVCIGANNTAWTDDAKRAVVAANDFSDVSFDPADILTQPYSLAWGAVSPWDAIETESGVVMTFELAAQPVTTDSEGTIDMTIEGVEVTAKLTPVGISEAQLLALLKIQGTGVTRGASLLTLNSNDLVASGTGVHVTLYDSVPTEGPFRFGRTVLRTGEIAFKGIRDYSSGAGGALFRLDTAAPE